MIILVAIRLFELLSSHLCPSLSLSLVWLVFLRSIFVRWNPSSLCRLLFDPLQFLLLFLILSLVVFLFLCLRQVSCPIHFPTIWMLQILRLESSDCLSIRDDSSLECCWLQRSMLYIRIFCCFLILREVLLLKIQMRLAHQLSVCLRCCLCFQNLLMRFPIYTIWFRQRCIPILRYNPCCSFRLEFWTHRMTMIFREQLLLWLRSYRNILTNHS